MFLFSVLWLLFRGSGVPVEVNDPLDTQSYIGGASESLIEELIARLLHIGAVFKDDYKTKLCLWPSQKPMLELLLNKQSSLSVIVEIEEVHALP